MNSISNTFLLKRAAAALLAIAFVFAICPSKAFATGASKADGEYVLTAQGQESLLTTQADEASNAAKTARTGISIQANNSFASSMAIPINSVTGDSLSSLWEEKWYKFTTRSDGALYLNVQSNSTLSFGGWRLKLYNSGKKEIESGEFELGGVDSKMIAVVGLPAGTYYIMVDSKYTDSSILGATYYITPSFLNCGAWETEFNDTLASADLLDELSDTAGTMSHAYDNDWFKFKLSKAGRFTLRMSSDTTASEGSWHVSLYDSSKRELDYGTYEFGRTKRQTLMTAGLPTGTYYLKVHTWYGDDVMKDVEYVLERTFTASASWETEFNDTFATADTTSIGSNRYGTVSDHSNEEDWFKFKTSSAGRLSLPMYSSTKARIGEWYVELYDSSKNLLTSGTYSLEKPAVQTLFTHRVGKGTYYLRVTSGYGAAHMRNIAYRITPQLKKTNTMTVKAKTVKVKYSKLKRATQTITASKAFTVKSAKGSVSYKKYSGNSRIKVSSKGKITVKKGLRKGTYLVKVTVTARGNAAYCPKARTVTVKVKVQ